MFKSFNSTSEIGFK